MNLLKPKKRSDKIEHFYPEKYLKIFIIFLKQYCFLLIIRFLSPKRKTN